MKTLNKTRLLILVLFSLLLAACSQEQPWAGVSKTGENDIFVSYDRFVARLDANGKRLWTFPNEDERDSTFFAPVVSENGTAYVGDYKGNVYAIDSQTGEKIWAYEVNGTKLFGIASFGGSTDRIIAPIAIAENVLFVPDELGVFALNKENGELLNWKLDSGRAVWTQPIYVPASEEGQPDILYVASLDHHLYALDVSEIDASDTVDEIEEAGEAKILWKADLDGAIAGQPTFDVERGILFAGTFGSELIAVDAETGEVLASYEAAGWVWDGPAIYEDVLYFGDVEGHLHAVRYEDGQFEEAWSKHITEGKLRARPVVTEDLVIIGSDDKTIYAVQRENGDNEWARDVEAEALSDLIQIDGAEDQLVVLATNNKDQLVLALRLDNGNERWDYKHED